MLKKRAVPEKVARFFKFVYLKLFRINDSPFKIALGFGLGVFVGVMPGMGLVIALVLSIALRLNRAAALLGCILFNTWIGFLSLVFSVKVGSYFTGANYQVVYDGWNEFLKSISWKGLWEISFWKSLWEVSFFQVLIPMTIGYFAIALTIAFAMTLIVYFVAQRIKSRKMLARHKSQSK